MDRIRQLAWKPKSVKVRQFFLMSETKFQKNALQMNFANKGEEVRPSAKGHIPIFFYFSLRYFHSWSPPWLREKALTTMARNHTKGEENPKLKDQAIGLEEMMDWFANHATIKEGARG